MTLLQQMARAAGDSIYGDADPETCPVNFARANAAVRAALAAAEKLGWVMVHKPTSDQNDPAHAIGYPLNPWGEP